MIEKDIPDPWRRAMSDALNTPEWRNLRSRLQQEDSGETPILPPADRRFAAFAMTPLDTVRIVILGQDPYHGDGQAHGLAFSVPSGARQPPSLINIFRELHDDLGIERPVDGNLSGWARQGVLLLNTALSVKKGQAGSHARLGWNVLTDAAISAVSRRSDPSVFVLWGAHARQTFERAVKDAGVSHQGDRHLVLTAPHPSPLSAYRGFFGSRPFSRANAFLQSRGRGRIDWADL